MESKSSRIKEYVNGYAQSILAVCKKFKRVKTYAKEGVKEFLEYVKDVRDRKNPFVRAMAADGLEGSMWNGNSYMRQVFQSETGICLGGYAQTRLVIDMLESGMRMDRVRRKAAKAKEYDGDRWHGWLDTLPKAKARQMNRWIDTEVLDFREKGQRVILGTFLDYMNWKYEMEGKLKTEVREVFRFGKKGMEYKVNGYYVCKSAYEYAKYLNGRKSLEDVVGWQMACEKVKFENAGMKSQKEAA